MEKRWLGTAVLLGFLAVAACRDDDPTGARNDADGGVPVSLTDQLDGGLLSQDAFTLLEAAIEGDTLRAQVGYGGGCRVHEFELVISRDFMESQPVQTTAVLAHDADDDPCEAFILTWLEADLVALKEAWQASYAVDSGTIILHLEVPALEAECDATAFSQPGRCSLVYSF